MDDPAARRWTFLTLRQINQVTLERHVHLLTRDGGREAVASSAARGAHCPRHTPRPRPDLNEGKEGGNAAWAGNRNRRQRCRERPCQIPPSLC